MDTKEPVSPAELRELLLKLADLLDRPGMENSAARTLRERIQALDAQAFQYLYRANGDWLELRIALALMSKGRPPSGQERQERGARFAAAGELTRSASPAGLPADLFTPAYPRGDNFCTFRASLPGLGALSDTPGSLPGLDDERCDANFEAGVAIATATFKFAVILSQAICDVLPEIADIPCWLANAVTTTGAQATETIAVQCALVDGAVDAAEIEAAYENTVAIYRNLDAHHSALRAHDADTKAAITNATTTLSTALAAHDTQIKAAINHATNVLSLALASHDAAIKALLANLSAGVDQNRKLLRVNQTLQHQVIRLLLTPEGRRTVNPALMTCTGDNCPKVLNCPGNECAFPISP